MVPTPLRDDTKNPKLTLIGPVIPFRGGIAQYTTELHRALAARGKLRTISFKRQYPAWLYPGESDREPGMREHREPFVDYSLDALNPLTWITAARSVRREECDLVLMDWWTMFWAPGFALIARTLRRRNIPVLFICHNLVDHDSSTIKRAVATRLLAQADAYLVHSEEQADQLRSRFPSAHILIHPHPTYDRFPPATKALPQRGKLELLFFGFIRPYKGLDTLIDALVELNDPDIYLTVVGEPWNSAEKLRSEIERSGIRNVELHLQYVDDATAANFFARADLIVLPYRSATGSGVAALAYHYDRPVIATRVGGLREVVEEGRTGFLINPGSPSHLAGVLRNLDRAKVKSMNAHVREYKSRFTWSSLADTIVNFSKR